MMYRIIGQALEKAGLSECNHPQDFLNFYCLGQREPETKDSSSVNNPTDNSALVCLNFILFSYFVLNYL